jgi:hypothetical protein
MDGLSLLKEIGAHAPETVSILLTGVADQKIAAECVQQKIFRMLAKPCGWEQLYQAVDEALAFHVQFLAHDMAEEELKFSKDSLESFTMLLEERLDHQTDALRRLHRFSLDLCSARGLKDVVDLAAQAAFDVLGGRGACPSVGCFGTLRLRRARSGPRDELAYAHHAAGHARRRDWRDRGRSAQEEWRQARRR